MKRIFQDDGWGDYNDVQQLTQGWQAAGQERVAHCQGTRWHYPHVSSGTRC